MRRLTVVPALLLLLAACTSDSDTPEVGGSGPAPRRNPDCPAAVDDALAAWEGAGFNGVLVQTGPDGTTCTAAYGVADRGTGASMTADTVFAIGSVSKVVTAAVIQDLVTDDLLALDDRAGDLVPGLTGPVADATVEDLLRHRSGLPGAVAADDEPLDDAATVERTSAAELAFPPGTDELYSNAGYTLLALIGQAVADEPWRDVVVERALTDGDAVAGGFWAGSPEAAGDRAQGYLDDGSPGEDGSFAGPYGATTGNGDLAMTMPDLAAWARRQAPPADADDVAAAGWGVLDASALGEPAVGAAGGGGDTGQEAVVVWVPGSEQVVAVASSTADVSAEDLLQTIGPALLAGDDLPRPSGAEADGPSASERAALAGRYELDGGDALVVADGDDGLTATAEGEAAVSALLPLPDGVAPDDAEAHSDAVIALLEGDSAAGREEREALEGDLGPIDAVRPAGTVVEDRELRTYVVLTSGDEETTGWYALDEEGGIAGVDIADGGPSVGLDPIGTGAFRPHDPTGRRPAVTLTFAEDELTIGTPAGPVTATRS